MNSADCRGARAAVRQPVTKHRAVVPDVQLDDGQIVDQPLVAAQPFERGAERGARRHRIEVQVHRGQFRALGQMQPEVLVAGLLDRPASSPTPTLIGTRASPIVERLTVDAGGPQQGGGSCPIATSPDTSGRRARRVSRGS